MAHTAHTRCRKGKRVVVLLRDGQRYEDYFEGYTSNAIVLRYQGRVANADLRAMVIARGRAFLEERVHGAPV